MIASPRPPPANLPTHAHLSPRQSLGEMTAKDKEAHQRQAGTRAGGGKQGEAGASGGSDGASGSKQGKAAPGRQAGKQAGER
eukprot:8882978-Alexandrium_andersonii.AAC.1